MIEKDKVALARWQLPTIADLISDKAMAFAQDDLNMIVNTQPPASWVKEHPMIKIMVNGKLIPLPYLPVRRVKYLLKRIFGKYEWKINNCFQLLNSIVVVGTLTVINPITGEDWSQDGIGAAAIQMDKDAPIGNLASIKSNSIQIGAPSAESYSLKNAAEKYGDIFGGNLYDLDRTSYEQVFSYDLRNPPPHGELAQLLEQKRNLFTPDELRDCMRVLDGAEKNSYYKLYKFIMTK